MITTDHLNGITLFVHAADSGGFTEAARQLGMSKSGVAKSVMRLEERLGVRLFDRTTRRFALTEDGQAFYDTCSRVLADLESVEATLTSENLQPRGKLRIAVPTVFGRHWLLPVLLSIAQLYPDLTIDVTSTDRHIDLNEEGYDLVLLIGEQDDGEVYASRQLGVQHSVICASPAYIEQHGVLHTVEDLKDHSCIVLTRSGRPLPWVFLDESGTSMSHSVSGRLLFNDAEAVSEAALAGQGVAHLSTWLIADHLRDGRLVQLLPRATTRGFPIQALWPRSRHISPRVRVVLDELVNRFLPEPPWNQEA